jgi:hypothetical protein
VTFELLDTEEEEEKDEDQEEDIELEKYSEYIEKYCTESTTDDPVLIDQLKPRLLTRPIFLTRNAHVLKCKLGVYTSKNSAETEATTPANATSSTTATDTKPETTETVKAEVADEERTAAAAALVVKERDATLNGSVRPKTNETTVKYRRNSFKKARKSHQTVTKRMYDKFRKLNNKWLKEHSKTADCIDDWLLGEMAAPATKTVCIKESQLKKVPYHVYYRYRVMPANPKPAAEGSPANTTTTGNKKNGAVASGQKSDDTAAVENKPSAVDSKTAVSTA